GSRKAPLFSPANREDRIAATVALTFWVALLALAAPVVFTQGKYTTQSMIVSAAFVLTAALLWLFSANRFVQLCAIGSILSGRWFNPLARGGAESLETNPLSARIKDLDRAAGGRSKWVSFAPGPVGNLFRAIGVRSIDGNHFYRQDGMWRIIDPQGRY